MRECRFFPWCSYIEDHGCTKDSCRHYQPMPDVDALLALAEEMQGYADGAASGDGFPYVNAGSLWSYADRIREACGEVA